MSARRHFATLLGVAALLLAFWAPASAQADFGFHDLQINALNQDGSPDLLAGSHPYEWRLSFELNADGEGNSEGEINRLIIDLPPGMLGNPQAVTTCPLVLFEGGTPLCPGSSQIGVARAKLGGAIIPAPIFNLAPPLGVAARFGLTIEGVSAFQDASIRTGADYGATASVPAFPALGPTLTSVNASIWGVPALAAHDPERYCPQNNHGEPGCSSEAPPKPFFTLPTSCGAPLKTTISMDSRQEPGVFQSQTVPSLDAAGREAALVACEATPFDPSITLQPETKAADSPTGLHVNLHIPQNEDPGGIATAHLKDTTVTLPTGLSLNPSAADGLGACSPAQIDLHGSDPANCPANSRLGTVEVKTPLLDHPVKGGVYLATQGDNPFNSLLALYIAIYDPITGVVIKLPGKVDIDQNSGRLSATFKESPQLPFEDFQLDFNGGPRASLTTPQSCGTYKTETALTPWSAPEGKTAFPQDSFQITSAPAGGRCAQSEAQLPNAPGFEAGTQTPIGGSYSPFVLKLSRENGSQRLAALNLTLPPGLAAKLAGTPYCSEAQIAAASSRSGLGQGALEKSSPSCPLASEVGTVNVGAGSGTPTYVQGKAYLSGPYKGAPLSLAIITPAIAGPFDLGVVVVRTALYVNETTAQVTAKSDPLPTILQGIPLDVRSIALNMNKPSFTLNPTNCDPMAITGAALSSLGQSANLQNRFQVGACNGLGFEPKLSIKLKGGTKRGAHPKLIATLTPRPGDANISFAQVTLPHSAFLDQAHIRTICTRVQFAASQCPKGSIYGKAKAFTPLLDKPLEGPVYLRSSSHKLPDLIADLNGQIHFVLAGRIDSVKGGIRNTFESTPDAPVSKFVLEMQGAKKGLLVNSTNICRSTNKATALLQGHNGKSYEARPVVGNGCSKKKHRR